MAEIDILVGTVYGSAMLVAETLSDHLQANGHVCQIFDDAALTDIDASRFLLIVTATTGQGDLPDSIASRFVAIRDTVGYQPELRYGMIALGDSSYDHFCGGGHKLDDLLQEQGAARIGDLLEIDAMENPEPETVAIPWVEKWALLLK